MATYLVTGGCGFIGSHLVDALHARGHAIRILDNLSTGTLRYTPPDVEVIFGDVADGGVVEAALAGVDGCFHLAAIASVERGNAEWLATHRTNLTGAVAVFDAARKAAPGAVPVVFASSAAVYGDNPSTPLSEQAVPRPLSAYGADKLGCELHAAVAAHVHHVPNCGLRFFNVYGRRQDPRSPYCGVISTFCDRLKAGREITVYGDGQQTRDFIYVGDVVQALRAAMENCSTDGDILNICTGRATMIGELAQLVGAIVGAEPDIRFAPPRAGEIRDSLGDPTRARHRLGFVASTDLKSGLTATLRDV